MIYFLIGLIVGLCIGASIAWFLKPARVVSENNEKYEKNEKNEKIHILLENIEKYDGTAKGQRRI